MDFYLGWEDYKYGFGDLHGNFWWGLEKLHQVSYRTLTHTHTHTHTHTISFTSHIAQHNYYILLNKAAYSVHAHIQGLMASAFV